MNTKYYCIAVIGSCTSPIKYQLLKSQDWLYQITETNKTKQNEIADVERANGLSDMLSTEINLCRGIFGELPVNSCQLKKWNLLPISSFFATINESV